MVTRREGAQEGGPPFGVGAGPEPAPVGLHDGAADAQAHAQTFLHLIGQPEGQGAELLNDLTANDIQDNDSAWPAWQRIPL